MLKFNSSSDTGRFHSHSQADRPFNGVLPTAELLTWQKWLVHKEHNNQIGEHCIISDILISMDTDRPQSLGNNFFSGACNSTKNLKPLVQKKKRLSHRFTWNCFYRNLSPTAVVSRGIQVSTGFHFYLVRTEVYGWIYVSPAINIRRPTQWGKIGGFRITDRP